jgi:excisionase family DNA binding protein
MPHQRNISRNWVSTIEAARLLGLCHMTVIRRFDAGDLKGYRVPGSRHRRIPRNVLHDYAARHGIPLATDAQDATPATAAGSGRAKLALVVEDDRHMADLMEKVLKADAWAVRVARNGFDAGFIAAGTRPRLVLLDIMLPGLDGREACRQMRSDPGLAETKILAVTALRDDRSITEIFEAGADGYLPKPFDLSLLRSKIAELTGAASGRRTPVTQGQGPDRANR